MFTRFCQQHFSLADN